MSSERVKSVSIMETVKTSGRVIWMGLVGLATLGGVLGLYQFLSDQGDSPLDSRTLVARMIESGALDAEKADELIALIDDTAGSETVLASAFEDGSIAQIEALAMVAKRSTFEQGIERLEAQAETADDWRMIAELSSNGDRAKALEAARKAVALDPGRIDLLELLAKTQLAKGDYQDASRTAASISVLATTPRERLMSKSLEGSLAIASADEARIDTAEAELEAELISYTSLPTFGPPTTPVKGRNIAEIAYWQAGYASTILAYLAYSQSEWETLLDRAEPAIKYYADLDSLLTGRSLTQSREIQAGLHDLRAVSMHRLERIENHHEAHEKAITLRRKLANAGDVKLQLELPQSLRRLAIEYAWLDDTETAAARMKTVIELAEQNAEDFPDEWELPYLVRTYRATLERIESRFDSSDEMLLSVFADVEDNLLRDGVDLNKFGLLTTVASNITSENRVMERKVNRISPLTLRLLEIINRLERRYGASNALSRLRITQMNILADEHMQLGNEDEVVSIYKDMKRAAEALPDEAQNKNSYILYALNALTRHDVGNAMNYAQEGLDMATRLNAEGTLTTQEQGYIPTFSKILEDGPMAD